MSKSNIQMVSPDAPPVQRNWWAYVIILVICVFNFLPISYVVMDGLHGCCDIQPSRASVVLHADAGSVPFPALREEPHA